MQATAREPWLYVFLNFFCIISAILLLLNFKGPISWANTPDVGRTDQSSRSECCHLAWQVSSQFVKWWDLKLAMWCHTKLMIIGGPKPTNYTEQKWVIEFISYQIHCLTVCKIFSGVFAMTIGLQFELRWHSNCILMALRQELYLMDIEDHMTELCGCFPPRDWHIFPTFMPCPIVEHFYLLMLFAELLQKLMNDLTVSFSMIRPFAIYLQLYILLTLEAFLCWSYLALIHIFELIK